MLLRLALVLSVTSVHGAYGKAVKVNDPPLELTELLKAHSLNLKANNQAGLSSTFSAIAAFYERSGVWKEAGENYLKALSFQKGQDQLAAAAHSSIHLAYVLNKESDYALALGYAADAAARYRELGQKDSTASSVVLLSELNRRLGRYRTAESLILKRALPLYRSAGKMGGRTRCFRSLGHTYWQQRRFSEAKWFFIQENMQARKLNDKSSIISSLLYLGRVKIDIGDYSLALKDFREAEQLARAKGERKTLSQVQEALALVYRKLGQSKSSGHYEALASVNRSESFSLKQRKAKDALLRFGQAQKQLIADEKLAIRPVKIAPAKKVLYVLKPVNYMVSLASVLLLIATVLFVWKRRAGWYTN